MKINKFILAAITIMSIVATPANAASPNNTKAKKAVAAAAAESNKATGPTAFGPIKFGMTKVEIEALTTADNFYLNAPMTDYVYSKSELQEAGKDKFKGLLMTPYRSEPMKGTFTFTNNVLSSMYFDLEGQEDLYKDLMAMVAKKYGAAKIDDRMKTEECIYKNGSNFTKKSGFINHDWKSKAEDSSDEEYRTSFMNMTIGICPDNLMHGSIPDMKILSLSMAKGKKIAPKPEAF